jgi:hypothetical protein
MNQVKLQETYRRLAKRAREQRNASKTNDDFDYWHKILNQAQLQLKTQENKK